PEGRLEGEAGPRQPLFVHDVRGGGWRIWRWLNEGFAPILAAEGTLVALGEPLTPPRGEAVGTVLHMRVTVIDMPTGAVRSRFVAPIASIAFASPDRLMLTSSETPSPGPAASPVAGLASTREALHIQIDYHASLYSIGGRKLGDLGTYGEPPRVSHMHLL